MSPVTELHRRNHEIGAIARAIDEESDRICAVIDNSSSFREREMALIELRQLARNVLACIHTLESHVSAEPDQYKAAA